MQSNWNIRLVSSVLGLLIVVNLHLFSSDMRNAYMFTVSGFKMTFGLTIIGSIAVTTFIFVNMS